MEITRVYVTIARNPTQDYPFEVRVGDDSGHVNSNHSVQCLTLRECLIAANGIATGVLAATGKSPSIVWDSVFWDSVFDR
jgi:hypothetical protein